MKIDDFTTDTSPAITAADGTLLRKGTVFTVLRNVELYNQLVSTDAKKHDEIATLIADLTELVPTLHQIGLFRLFSPIEWLAGGSSPGRLLVAALYLKHYPEQITEQVRQQLSKFAQSGPRSLIQVIEQVVS